MTGARGWATAGLLVLLAQAGAVLPLWAQGAAPAEPGCAAPPCRADAEPMVVATEAGSFAGADAASEADDIAALEQQAFREFRWDVRMPARVSLVLDAPAGAVEAAMLVSSDGERFAPLEEGGPVAPGQVLAVVLRQARTELEGGAVRFVAADWAFDLTAAPIVPLPGPTVGPVLIPVAVGDALGCDSPGCGEDGARRIEAPAVTGLPEGDEDVPGAAAAGQPGASAGAAASGADDLALALQRELARVGCYGLELDGLWGPGSRRAVEAFNAATGQALPAGAPTPDTLVAVARMQEAVCGK